MSMTLNEVLTRYSSFENEVKRTNTETKLEIIYYYTPKASNTTSRPNSIIYKYTSKANWQNDSTSHLVKFAMNALEGLIVYTAAVGADGYVSLYRATQHVITNINTGFSNEYAESHAKHLISVYYKAVILFGADVKEVLEAVASQYATVKS